MYLKIASAHWANTAIIIFVIVPFVETLTPDLLFQVYTVLLADMFSYPVYRLLDPVGHFNRFVLGPLLGRNQAIVNSYFQATEWR